MKKYIIILCLLMLSFIIVGCDSKSLITPTAMPAITPPITQTPIPTVTIAPTATPAITLSVTQTPPTVMSTNPLMLAEIKTAVVKSGSGANIGTRAYIEISKSDLEQITYEEYVEFIDERLSTDYNWVSIICNDGTGIIFTGSIGDIASYGIMDNEGRVDPVYGYIINRSGEYKYEAADGMESQSLNLSWG